MPMPPDEGVIPRMGMTVPMPASTKPPPDVIPRVWAAAAAGQLVGISNFDATIILGARLLEACEADDQKAVIRQWIADNLAIIDNLAQAQSHVPA